MKTQKTEQRKLVNFSSFFKLAGDKVYGAAVLHCGKEVQCEAYNGGKALHSLEGAVCAAAYEATKNLKKGDVFTMIVDYKTIKQFWHAYRNGDVTEDFEGNKGERDAILKLVARVPALRKRGVVFTINAHRSITEKGGYLAKQLPIWFNMAKKAMRGE